LPVLQQHRWRNAYCPQGLIVNNLRKFTKKIILLSTFIFLFSCNLNMSPVDFTFYSEIPDLSLSTVQDITTWTADNITWKKDDWRNVWQNPFYTFAVREGDCEDISLLALYLIKRDVGITGRAVIGTSQKDDSRKHCWIEIVGTWWEPQKGRTCSYYHDCYADFRYVEYEDLMGDIL